MNLPYEATMARICFTFGFLVLLARASWWLAFEEPAQGSWLKVILGAAFIFGSVGCLWVISMSWVSHREIVLSSSGLEVDFRPEYQLSEYDGETLIYRIRVHNSSTAMEAKNVGAVIVNIAPRPKDRAFNAHFPYELGITNINPRNDKYFVIAKSWRNSEGIMISIEPDPEKQKRIQMGADEVWTMKLMVSSANAGSKELNLFLYIEHNKLIVSSEQPKPPVQATTLKPTETQSTKRPYFVLYGPEIIKATPELKAQFGSDYVRQFSVANTGKHAESNLYNRQVSVDQLFQMKPQIVDGSKGNEIATGTGSINYAGVSFPAVIVPSYLVIAIKYQDRKTLKTYSQIWCFKQSGGTSQAPPLHFMDTSIQEREDILAHLKQELEDYIETPPSKQKAPLSFLLADCTFDGQFDVQGNFDAFRKAFPESGNVFINIDIYPKNEPDQDINVKLNGHWHGTSGTMDVYDDSIVFNAADRMFFLYHKKPTVEYATQKMTHLYANKEYEIQLTGIPG